MKLRDSRKLAIELMAKHHLLPIMFNFKFSNGRVTLGYCNYAEGEYEIRISKHYVRYHSEEKVRDLILHEIAHALDYKIRGETNHDEFWKEIFRRIGGSGETLVS